MLYCFRRRIKLLPGAWTVASITLQLSFRELVSGSGMQTSQHGFLCWKKGAGTCWAGTHLFTSVGRLFIALTARRVSFIKRIPELVVQGFFFRFQGRLFSIRTGRKALYETKALHYAKFAVFLCWVRRWNSQWSVGGWRRHNCCPNFSKKRYEGSRLPRHIGCRDFAALPAKCRFLPVSRGCLHPRRTSISPLDAFGLSDRRLASAQMPCCLAAAYFWTADALGSFEDAVLTWLLTAAAGILSGALGAMGMGGGGILILCLTMFAGIEQNTAQGVNLLLFIPTALLALIPYIRQKLICRQAILPAVLSGIVGSLLGVWLSGTMNPELLQKLFGGLLLLIGLREIFSQTNAEKP